MDKLDKISILFLLIFIAVIAFVSAEYSNHSVKNINRSLTHAGNTAEAKGISDDQIKILKNLIEANNLHKAEALLNEFLGKCPYEGELHILMGDVMMRKQDAVGAIYKYKEAVDLNPDYLDKKTPLFQGYKIKVAIEEAKVRINDTLSKRPDDQDMKAAKKNMYYLLKKLAGSCG
jgi:lipopolysaccharide biosynthesis regulator YciM